MDSLQNRLAQLRGEGEGDEEESKPSKQQKGGSKKKGVQKSPQEIMNEMVKEKKTEVDKLEEQERKLEDDKEQNSVNIGIFDVELRGIQQEELPQLKERVEQTKLILEEKRSIWEKTNGTWQTLKQTLSKLTEGLKQREQKNDEAKEIENKIKKEIEIEIVRVKIEIKRLQEKVMELGNRIQRLVKESPHLREVQKTMKISQHLLKSRISLSSLQEENKEDNGKKKKDKTKDKQKQSKMKPKKKKGRRGRRSMEIDVDEDEDEELLIEEEDDDQDDNDGQEQEQEQEQNEEKDNEDSSLININPSPQLIQSLKRELAEKTALIEKIQAKINKKAIGMAGPMVREFEGLQQRREKLEKDKVSIEKAMNELDELKLKLIQHTWEQINKNFNSIFSSVLPEAKAELIAVRPDALLEGGLEIRAGLGGVWKEGLTELSGGQKSLLSLSLILALLSYRPAPVYILDEIDAALDLSHTQNIGAMLRTHFTSSQFIIVSLKEGMFNNANVLFQVRFFEGESKVIRARRRGNELGIAAADEEDDNIDEEDKKTNKRQRNEQKEEEEDNEKEKDKRGKKKGGRKQKGKDNEMIIDNEDDEK
ncbi:MAG: putative Structural maintenance of chromosomes protein 2 [Streblomastix strix]|uniref:Putative Structural maintenance of chromosomes protein 2 n=1 Tax=Streblomastix strix TaxID=222440 RepID=A0A5J4V426_9EUKA|nr:MAG: putative Structural maintenance of chromosomes protein 2 [Streblomastix strix]